MNVKVWSKFGCVTLVLCLLAACGSPIHPRVSQFSGSRLAFQTAEADRTALVGVNWSPSGRLVLQGWNVGGQFPLYVADVRTGTMTPLCARQQHVSGGGPVLSPTGESVAFFDSDARQIRILRIDQPSQIDLLLPYYGYATWSPDGQQLAVTNNVSNTISIRLVDLQGQEIAQVFELSDPHLRRLRDIAWSPNGKQIAFTLIWDLEAEDNSQGDIYILSLDTGDVIQLTGTPSMNDCCPSWSPDGERLVFSSAPVGSPTEVVGQLFFASADGSCVKPVPSPVGIDSPSWSPDGTQIAVASEGEIYILDVASLGAEFMTTPLSCPE